LGHKLAAILPDLTETQRRRLLATEARSLGRGGISRVARASGVSRPTIQQGRDELAYPTTARIRQVGGGRKKSREHDPTLVGALEALVDPDSRGDPMSPLRWTCKSTRQLAQALKQQGHRSSARVVRALLHEAGYSLQAPAKTVEGRNHPDRAAPFQDLNDQSKTFLAQGLPGVSVDAKKQALVGAFKHGGRAWPPQGHPEEVKVHAFPDPKLGKALPYGVDDVGRNAGGVTVGQDHDTASFAVASLPRWWQVVGGRAYPPADRLLISADSGGSHGYRTRLWKVELPHFADATGLPVTVCHLPPGTSTWHKIAHRLCSHISMNWRGRPLVSHEVIVELIGATTTRTGLQVQAEFDTGTYPTKIKVSNHEMAALQMTPHPFHGEWNYTIMPTSPEPEL
jgi:transposase